jgi:parvulin-like peptidyl-prolyl isomerase
MLTRGELASEFGRAGEAVGAAFALPVNAISVPIRQLDGVYVERVDARKPADRVAFEAQKKLLREQRLQQIRQQRLQAYFEDLRKSAKIDDRRKEITAELKRQSAS